ncbi:MAG: hypothetical protein JST48_11885 [Bacteroidetes bacterium]|nr:hypothetical protein [Bacteroidota bacterium]
MNQLLVPFFERITGNQMSPINKMLLLNIDKSQPNINSTIVINIPTSVEDQFIEFVQEVKDYFIVATGVTTYKVSSNGDTLKISDHGTAKVFTYNNNVYILDFYGNAVVSNNDWLSWHEEKIAEQFAYGLMQSIGDSLIFINNSNFYTLNFRPGYWFLRELENDGIDKEIVTTLTDFNDSIYSTTYSGVYYKSKKDFFKSKAKK